jgi:phage-related protein
MEKGSIDVHVQKIVRDKMRKIDEFMRPFTEEELSDMPNKIKELEAKYPAECRRLWMNGVLTER